MDIGILGTGVVGQTLGTKLLELGHAVQLGSRSATNDKAAAWVAQAATDRASHGTFQEAAEFGELVVLATLGTGTLEAVQQAGPEQLAGKILVDVTNPLDFSQGMPPRLFVGHTDSLAEQVQRTAPAARVVKALNIVNHEEMVNPAGLQGEPDMFIAGHDAEAKQQVTELLQAFGWRRITDFGGLEAARFLEPLVLLWVQYAIKTGGWHHALQFVRRAE